MPDGFKEIRKNLEKQRDVTLSTAHVRQIVQATRAKFSQAQSELWHHFCCKPCVARSERASIRKVARRRQQIENLTDISKLASSQKNLQLLLQVVLSPN